MGGPELQLMRMGLGIFPRRQSSGAEADFSQVAVFEFPCDTQTDTFGA